MTPITSKIYKLPESAEFIRFVNFFNLRYLYSDEILVLYNDCFIVWLYTEYRFPFMHFFHYPEMKKTEVNRLTRYCQK